MRINSSTAISTTAILLVPYEPRHVPTYHQWMQSSELQALTASEPLSSDEEHAMQRSWRDDADKLTFIVCLPRPAGAGACGGGIDDRPARMLGDVNLFLSRGGGGGDDHDHGDDDGADEGTYVVGELELMVAEPSARRKGYGRAALLAFLRYVAEREGAVVGGGEAMEGRTRAERLEYLRVRIGEGNAASLALFRGLGFETFGGVNYFGEVELRLGLAGTEGLRKRVEGWEETWGSLMAGWEEVEYVRAGSEVEGGDAVRRLGAAA